VETNTQDFESEILHLLISIAWDANNAKTQCLKSNRRLLDNGRTETPKSNWQVLIQSIPVNQFGRFGAFHLWWLLTMLNITDLEPEFESQAKLSTNIFKKN
jgi:hypothetical protein